MILANDLLLLLVTVMHISSTASKPLVTVMHISTASTPLGCKQKLGLQARPKKELFINLLEDLKYAESLFVERLFFNTTSETKTKSLKPLDGIAIPAGNMNLSSTLNSMSEINGCLTTYLKKVINILTTDEYMEINILKPGRDFNSFFRQLAAGVTHCWTEGERKVCPENLANNQTGYEMKDYGLHVLLTAVKWTEGYIK